MKILLVLDCPAELINGVSQSVLNLQQGLSAEGHEVRLLMPSPDGKMRIEGDRLLAPSHGFSRAYPGFRFSLTVPRLLRNYIYRWKPDVIHSNTEGVLYFKAISLAHRTGAVHIHSFHTNFLDFYYPYFPFSRRFTQALMLAYGHLCFRKNDAVIMPSLWGKQIMERFHFPAPHYILPNGIHTEIFSADHKKAGERIRRTYGVKEDDVLLLFAGRAAEEKNIPELISDFCTIEDKHVKLMIAGGGPALASLKKTAETQAEKERIFFTDMIPCQQIADYYAAADIFVTASRSEVQPLTYVEAMASSLPVVCASAPYVEGLVVDGETGFCFNSAKEFAEAVRYLCENPEQRQVMGAKAEVRVSKEYSIPEFARSALGIYARTLKGACR